MAQHEEEMIIDQYIGQRMREFRRARGLTQTQVADALDVTFQQVQKYEKGVNRLSASKLMVLAQFLGHPVTEFYPSQTGGWTASTSTPTIEPSMPIRTASPMSRRLQRAFESIEEPNVQRLLVGIAQALGKSTD
jgi:transcriptional regulator with XRE-family HTH domain